MYDSSFQLLLGGASMCIRLRECMRCAFNLMDFISCDSGSGICTKFLLLKLFFFLLEQIFHQQVNKSREKVQAT